MVPSVVGVGQTNLGMLSLAGVTGRRRRRRKVGPYRVTFNGADMLVGASVAEYARPVEGLDFQRLGESPEAAGLDGSRATFGRDCAAAGVA